MEKRKTTRKKNSRRKYLERNEQHIDYLLHSLANEPHSVNPLSTGNLNSLGSNGTTSITNTGSLESLSPRHIGTSNKRKKRKMKA